MPNKNNGAYVEQNNWSVVRRPVGYHRYDTPDEPDLLNGSYFLLRLQTNFFSPPAEASRQAASGRVGDRSD